MVWNALVRSRKAMIVSTKQGREVLYCIYIQIIVVFIKHSDHYKCRVMNWHRLLLLGYFRQSSLFFFSACRKGPRIGTIFGNTRIIYNYNLIVFIGEFANCISVLWRLNFIIQIYFTNDFGESPNSVFYFEKVNLQDGHCFFDRYRLLPFSRLLIFDLH